MRPDEQEEILRALKRHADNVEDERAEGFTLRNLAGQILTLDADVRVLQTDMKSIRPRVAVLESVSGITVDNQTWMSRHWVTVMVGIATLFVGALVSACVTVASRKFIP